MIEHPDYAKDKSKWKKWRLAYEGGDDFIETYLKVMSSKEAPADFQSRKEMTYVPAFAKNAIHRVRNSLAARLINVRRQGGPGSYQESIIGSNGGVDRMSSTMRQFMSQALNELLPMRRVGIYVERDLVETGTKLEMSTNKPYLYIVPTENIVFWEKGVEYFKRVILEDKDENGNTIYREYILNDQGTMDINILNDRAEIKETTKTELTLIPFSIAEISNSLMQDICQYQIALLNLASSDIAYALKANFTTYVEEQSSKGNAPNTQGQQSEITIGPMYGRAYAYGTKIPSYINPSPEPLRVSMEKQARMKAEIDELIDLAISSLSDRAESAAAKNVEQQTLENGLQVIGSELERVERQIAAFWSMYEGSEPAQIFYPDDYRHKTDIERVTNAKQFSELLTLAPSTLFQREIGKTIAVELFGGKVSAEILQAMLDEIDTNPMPQISQEIIYQDIERNVLSPETAAQAKGYPAGESEKAAEAHKERAAAVVQAQTKAKGGVTDGESAKVIYDNPIRNDG